MTDEKQLGKFQSLCDSLSAHFPDGYMIVAESGENLFIRASSEKFGIFACERYVQSNREEHLLMKLDARIEEEENED